MKPSALTLMILTALALPVAIFAQTPPAAPAGKGERKNSDWSGEFHCFSVVWV